jgi:hypothetical protein
MVTQKKKINNLIQEIKNKKVATKGQPALRLDLEPADLDFLIKLLKRSAKLGQLEKLIDVLDDEAEFYLNMIVRARKLIPSKGAGLKDYQEALKILNAELPKRGQRPTYTPKKVKEILKHHKSCKDKLRNKKNPLTLEQKRSAVKTVNKKHFPMSDPDSTRLFLFNKYKKLGTPSGEMELPGRVKIEPSRGKGTSQKG